VETGNELPRVADMVIVGTYADLHVVSVAMAGRLPVSEREATPRHKWAYFHVSVSYSSVVKPEVVCDVSL